MYMYWTDLLHKM